MRLVTDVSIARIDRTEHQIGGINRRSRGVNRQSITQERSGSHVDMSLAAQSLREAGGHAIHYGVGHYWVQIARTDQ